MCRKLKLTYRREDKTERGAVLRKNKYGNYEHPSTGFVFDKDTKRVYGRQVENNIEKLTDNDIETCKRLNFKVAL